MKKIFTTIFLAVLCQLVVAQAGTLDSSFGNFGIARTDMGNLYRVDNEGYEVLTRPDGSFYLVSRVQRQVIISLRLANGALDPAYGEGGYSQPVHISGGAAVMQADGKILIGGAPSYGGFPGDFVVARMNTNGFPDTSFSGDGIVRTDFFDRSESVSGLAVQPDGKIIAVGGTNDGGQYSAQFAIARYNPDGSLDNSFSGDGLVMTNFGYSSYAQDVAVQPDGRIVVAGVVNYRLVIVRYLPDGTLDNSFSYDGFVIIHQGWWLAGAEAVSIQSDGKIVAGGYVNIEYAGLGRFLLVRVNSDGTPDNSFSDDGITISNYSPLGHEGINDIAIQPDGKILATGSSYITGHRDFIIARYNSNGTQDNSFSGDGIDVPGVSNDAAPGTHGTAASSLALLPDGKIMIAGTANYVTAVAVRYLSNGTLDNSLDADGILKDRKEYGKTAFRGVAVQADGKIVVAAATGIETQQPQFGVARYNTNGTLDPSFSGDGKLIVDFGPASAEAVAVAIQPDGKILVAGNVTSNNNADFAVVRLNADGTLDNSFSGDGKVLTDIRGYNDGVTGIALRPNGKIVVGGFSNLWGADNDLAVVQYLPDGALDASFSGDGMQITDLGTATDMANAIALQQDGKIVLAGKKGYSAEFARSRIAVVRYDMNGAIDASFGSNGIVLTEASFDGHNEARALAIDANGNIVVAGGAGFDLAILRYTPGGLPDSSFSGDGKQLLALNVYGHAGLAIQPDGKLVAGNARSSSGNLDFLLVRLNTDGSPDNSFSGDGQVQLDLSDGGDDMLFALAQHGNRIYAAGSTPYGGISGCVAVVLTGSATCNVTAVIPDSYPLDKGVEVNTVYSGYFPAASLILTAQVSGGTAPYTYEWSNGVTTMSVAVMPAAATIYTVTVTDANGCRTTVSKLVNSVDVRCGNNMQKVIICHVPPDNPSHSNTKCLNTNAVAAHLNSGSYLGNCKPELITMRVTSPIVKENHAGLQVYPNPSGYEFRLVFVSTVNRTVNIVVHDVAGRVIEKKTVQPNHAFLLGRDYRPGVYTVELFDGKEKFQAKLVKQ